MEKKLEIHKIKVDKNNIRLDLFLKSKLNVSRSKVQELIKNELISLNHQKVKKNGVLVFENDIIQIEEKDNENSNQSEIKAYDFPLKILYEDDFLMIVYKPSGMLVHPTLYKENDTLTNALRFYSQKNKIKSLTIAHRIDKDTSGLVLVAKDDNTLSKLQKMFENHQIKKRYYAIVHHRLNHMTVEIDVPIGRSSDTKLKMQSAKGKNLKQAQTIVRLVENFKSHALVDVEIKTGRTHQIRTHMLYINHPILNDPLYGNGKKTTEYGQYLMAYYLSFVHPITGDYIEQKLPLDDEFIDIIKTFKKEEE